MRARLLLLTATAASLACSARETPQPKLRAHAAPTVAQGRPAPVDEALALEAVEVGLRTGRTRVGEAVRLHVSAWRPSEGLGVEPVVELVENDELDGRAAVERMGSEIIEEHEGLVRERVDFRVEPSAVGMVSITILVPTPGKSPERRELTLVIAEALPKAELARQLATQAGRLERGRSLARQGDYRRAIEAFNLALEHAPDDAAVLSELGWAAFLAGEHSLARRATRQGLRHETDDRARGALLYNLGRIAEAREREDEAIAAYRRSLEVRPGSAPVRKRLTRLEARRPTPTCAAPGCPLSEPVDAIRACELVEQEGCPLVRQRAGCRCAAESIAKLDAIGPWRLLTLVEPDEAGINQVFFLLADAAGQAEPRYHVFAPLQGSHFHGELRGGVRSAELLDAGQALLRIDFEGTLDTTPLPLSPPPQPDSGDESRLTRAWTLLCAIGADGRPTCAAPLLSGYQRVGEAAFVAPVVVAADGIVTQTVEAGTAPTRGELDLDFPGGGMQVLGEPTRLF